MSPGGLKSAGQPTLWPHLNTIYLDYHDLCQFLESNFSGNRIFPWPSPLTVTEAHMTNHSVFQATPILQCGRVLHSRSETPGNKNQKNQDLYSRPRHSYNGILRLLLFYIFLSVTYGLQPEIRSFRIKCGKRGSFYCHPCQK